ncbi:hypothetical protein JCM24511_06946 [Saitozyma sp. JCM 24511]|nr:hypothetical protein JCM24511_06946 [Saitozyma sp. JCM 24511]
MAETTLHRRSLYSVTEPIASDGSSGGDNGPAPSFAIIPSWSTRLKVATKGGDTKDCLILNIKPRVAVTLRPGQHASMSFDMVGGVLSGPGCEAVESAFESLRGEWLNNDREPVSPAQAWKAAIESSESARTIPAVVERIAALEPEWRAFLTRFSDTSNNDATRNFSCRVSSRKDSMLVLNTPSETSMPTTEHQFYIECHVPIAVRPETGRLSASTAATANFPTSFDIYPGVQMMTGGSSGAVEPVDFVSNVVSGHRPSRDSLRHYVDTLEGGTDGTKKNTRMNLLHVSYTREYSRVAKVIQEMREEGIETAQRYSASHKLTVIP